MSVMGDEHIYTEGNQGFFTKNWFSRRDIICSATILRMFSEMLSPPSSFVVSKALWKKDRFIIYLSGDGVGSTISIIPGIVPNPDEVVGDCSVFHSGFKEDVSSLIIRNVHSWMSRKRLSDIFLSIFLDEDCVIRKDGEIYKNKPNINFNEWYYFFFGSRESKFLFINQGQFSTRIGGRLQIRHPTQPVNIDHADYECRKMGEHLMDPMHNAFIDAPVSKKDSDSRRRDDEGQPRSVGSTSMNPNQGSRKVSGESIMYDHDIIDGGLNNLSHLIDRAIANDSVKDIYVNCCCTPLIIGDDVKGLLRQRSRETDKNLAYDDVSVEGARDRLLESYRNIPQSLKKREPSTGTISLVGFPDSKGRDEIEDMLSHLGVEVGVCLLPEVSESLIRKSVSSEAQVLFPNKNYDRIYSDLFDKLGMKTIMPNPPYGFYRSSLWFKEICDTLGITENNQLHKSMGNLQERYSSLKEEAGKHTVGLVITRFDHERIADETAFHESIPLLPLLEDMGFNLNILVYSEKSEYLKIRRDVSSVLERNHEISFCIDEDVLEDWLDRNDIDIIYSDFKFDERILRRGKHRISLSLGFEMGFEGAIRNVEKILRITSRCFTKKYKDYLTGEYFLARDELEVVHDA